MVGEVVDDLFDSFVGWLDFFGSVDREVELLEKLRERGVVHPGDQRHLHGAEVQDGASRGHGPILFSLLVDLQRNHAE